MLRMYMIRLNPKKPSNFFERLDSVTKINTLSNSYKLAVTFPVPNIRSNPMISFSGRHYPVPVILQCVRWYVSYALSYQRWSQKFGQCVKLLFMTKGGSLI